MRKIFIPAKTAFWALTIIVISQNLWATTVAVRATKGRSTSSFSATYSRKTQFGTASWTAKLNQNSSGLFAIQPSDFISMKTDFVYRGLRGTMGLGEIRFDSDGLKSITNPSTDPQYTGLWFRSSRLDVAAFTPVLKATSPQGILGFLKTTHLTAGAGFYTRSPKAADPEAGTWQTDYSSVKTAGSEGYFSLNTGTQDGGIEVVSTLNQFKGLNTTEKLGFNYGGFSYALRLDGTEERTVSYTTYDGPFSIGISFYESKGKNPIYGGTAQKAQFKLSSDVGWNNMHVKTTSIKTYQEDTGSESLTKTGFSMEGTVDSRKYTMSVTAVLRRTSGTGLSFLLPELAFKSKGVSFSFKDSKGVLEFKKTFQINGAGVVVCFNQNRLITVYTTLEL